MVKYREILRQRAMGVSVRNTAFSCRCSTATVRAVTTRAKAHGLEWPLPEEMNDAIARVSEYDLVFVDTAGFSHRNEAQCQDMKKLIDGLDEAYEKEVYLVLSATTKYKDLLEIADTYREIANYKLIFTKLDETITYGNILNIKLYSGAKLSYMTSGQNVPDDIEVFDTQKIVKQLLGGR